MNLLDIENYTDEMTISQVIRFFERKNIFFTKTMIQNYVKVELLPPPLHKRYYLKKHLILLSFIDNLKSVYSLSEMKYVFSLIDVSELYSNYIDLYNQLNEENIRSTNENLKTVSLLADAESVNAEIKNFLTILMLMNQSVLIKQQVTNLLEGQN